MKKGPQTTTLSVRITVEQAGQLRERAAAAGFTSMNKYLIAAINILAPVISAPAPENQPSGATESWQSNQKEDVGTEKSAASILSGLAKA